MTAATLAEWGRLAPPDLMPSLRMLGDLKRIRSAGHEGSIATRLFAAAWAEVAAGAAIADVVRRIVRQSLAATQLGDLDYGVLHAAGIPPADIRHIHEDAIAAAAAPLGSSLREWLTEPAPAVTTAPSPPGFVARLTAQPRAGATCPGRGRLVLEPPENHAEHCAMVAIYAVILAPIWGARAETVFLAGLAHHLHNALLPDAGFAGEVLLGEWLQPAMARATGIALGELSTAPRAAVEAACRILPDATTPEGRAFHAADTLDRVLQVEHHLRASDTRMDFVLREMELVHAGPVKPFQDAVLTRMGLAA
jgi:hypothetical protein